MGRGRINNDHSTHSKQNNDHNNCSILKALLFYNHIISVSFQNSLTLGTSSVERKYSSKSDMVLIVLRQLRYLLADINKLKIIYLFKK